MNGERLAETPNIGGAYPRLSARHVRLLSQHGETRSVQPGQVLVSEGQRERDFLVVLSGKVAVFEAYGTPQARMV
ncbi:MAG: cyclic nucleotide-binding protein, partial [Catenulispora sp.]